MYLKPCEGCGLDPVDVAPPQVKAKAKYQCPHYASHDRDKCTDLCWGMIEAQYYDIAENQWNNGKTKYFEYIKNLK